jgi:hypothetical protein
LAGPARLSLGHAETVYAGWADALGYAGELAWAVVEAAHGWLAARRAVQDVPPDAGAGPLTLLARDLAAAIATGTRPSLVATLELG